MFALLVAFAAHHQTVASCEWHLVRAIDYNLPLHPVWRFSCEHLTHWQRHIAWQRALRITS
jgi:hypothetical protein